jgi:hypothetical protein
VYAYSLSKRDRDEFVRGVLALIHVRLFPLSSLWSLHSRYLSLGAALCAYMPLFLIGESYDPLSQSAVILLGVYRHHTA